MTDEEREDLNTFRHELVKRARWWQWKAETLEKENERLKSENAELKSSLTHANEECLKWHERAQNLLKDSGGSISGYEKKISALQAENAALREKFATLNKMPCNK